ncbi:cell wall-binding repeat-containing protein [Rossellomorea vietnamensis]|uniref:Cell wall-binding repeat-containing protein n=1 Tax=Rossellomorea vietnamensis TaxID=218284 RepID=A0ACD4C3Z6_9BACI|nr:cell wall-binding repeat-containing protein [Rossellomorea vietnamensis]UXH43338.1 cell wall-binding repeat-containing protein [Rossellomorea vietnamensis]
MKKNLKRSLKVLTGAMTMALMVAPTTTLAEVKDEKAYVDYLALGDSLAAGVLYDNSLGKGYPDILADEFKEDGFQVDFNKNFAVPGYTSKQVLADIQDPAKGLQKEIMEADTITLDAGANDLLQLIEQKDGRISIDPVKVQAALKEVGVNIATSLGIIRQLNPDVPVYVMGYYNAFPYLPQETQAQLKPALDGLNQAIQAASVHGGGVFVPVEEAMADNFQVKLPNPQNVHPSEAGYEAMAGEFWKVMEPVNDTVGKSTARLFGQDRYGTAAEISEESWDSTGTVIIARGNEYPDALVGTPLAYQLEAPILLTNGSRLSDETIEEIGRLGAEHAVILGGVGAVPEKIESELEDLGLNVDRIGGDDRFETAAFVANELGHSDTAVVAYGYDFPDALAVAPYAAQQGYPILLTETMSVPEATGFALQDVENTYVIGGGGVISEDLTFKNGERLAGDTRYDTAAAIYKEFQGPANYAVVATGQDFADALTGSVFAAINEVPLLLVKKDDLPQQTKGLVMENGLKHFMILGGEGAVESGVVEKLVK